MQQKQRKRCGEFYGTKYTKEIKENIFHGEVLLYGGKM